jgi:hypothetical protein
VDKEDHREILQALGKEEVQSMATGVACGPIAISDALDPLHFKRIERRRPRRSPETEVG